MRSPGSTTALLAFLILSVTVPLASGCKSGISALGSGGGGGASSTSNANAVAGSGVTSAAAGTGGSTSGPACPTLDAKVPEEVLTGTKDPAGGKFSMDEALADLPTGPGPLRAVIDTDLGTVTCTLRPDKAPNGVANFVGLARGRRPWRDPVTHKWVKRRFYDGLLFHRVIPMFMAQGGDPLGDGTGGPGYSFKDEIADLKHTPGTLAYANSGKNTNGSQFYITEVTTSSLDGGYTIIGACEPVSVVTALTHVKTVDPANSNDKPVTDLHMKTITITRCAP